MNKYCVATLLVLICWQSIFPGTIPYKNPQKRKDIIANLEYIIQYNDQLLKESRNPPVRVNGIRLLSIVRGKAAYKIGKMFRIENRNISHSKNYYWLIFVMDKEDKLAFVMTMTAEGKYTGFAGHYPSNLPQRKRLLIGKEDILKLLSSQLKHPLSNGHVKEIKRVGYKGPLSRL
jgi:hypothetical protein